MQLSIITPTLALRVGLRALLASEQIEVVYEAASLADLAEAGFPHRAAEAVLLVTTQVISGTGLQRLLSRQEGRLALLALHDAPEPGLVQVAQLLASLPLRAWGLLPLDAAPDELQIALQAVNEGLVVAPPALFAPAAVRQLIALPEVDPPLEPLTERESQVLQLLAQGLANKQIAVSLGISEHTVKFHISSIYSKLGASSRTEAVRSGVQHGLVFL